MLARPGWHYQYDCGPLPTALEQNLVDEQDSWECVKQVVRPGEEECVHKRAQIVIQEGTEL